MPNIDELIAQLKSSDLEELKLVFQEMGELGDTRAVPHLLEKLNVMDDEDTIEAILWTISRLAETRTLIGLLNHPNQKVISEVLDALGRKQATEAVGAIKPFLNHKNDEIRALATWAVGKMMDDSVYDLLLELLKTDPNPEVRAHAAWGIGKYDKIKSIPILKECMNRETEETVLYNLEEAVEHLEDIQDPWQREVAVSVYDCPKHEPACENKVLKTETRCDTFVRIEFILCETCPFANICRVTLSKRF